MSEGMKLSVLIGICRWSEIPARIKKKPEEVKMWEYGNLPIHRACKNENTPLVVIKELIDAYPKSLEHKCETLGRLPLHYAIRCSPVNPKLIYLLINYYKESVIVQDETGHTSLTYHLWWSSPKTTLEVVEILVKAKSDVLRICDNYGYYPLHHAAKYCNMEICLYLIELYPEALCKETKSGLTPTDIVYTVDKANALYTKMCEEEKKFGGKVKNKEISQIETRTVEIDIEAKNS